MKKRKLLSCLLVFSLSVGLLAACGSSDMAEIETQTETTIETIAGNTSAERTGIDAKWLNSNIVNYITEDTPASLQDDFALAVNKDYCINTQIKAGRSSNGTLYAISDEVEKQLIDLFETDLVGHDADIIRTAAETFGNWDMRNELGVEPIMPYVEDILSLESIEDINTFVSDPERNYKGFGIPMFDIKASYDDAENNAVYLYWLYMQADCKDYYEEDSDVGKRQLNYHKSADIYMLQRIGYSEDEAEEIYQQALSFEKKMAENLYTYEETTLTDYFSRTNNSFTETQLDELSGNYPLTQFLNGWELDGSNEYIVYAPAFIEAMSDLWTEENVSEIRSYILNMYLHENIKNIDREAYDFHTDISSDYEGTDVSMPDEEITLEYIENTMENVLDNVYIQTYGDEEVKEDILDMCDQVISYYRTMLESQEWLSEETREEAIKKLDNIVVFSCYPETLFDTVMYNIEDGSNVVEMDKQLSNGNIEEIRQMINTKVDRSEWKGYPSYEVNATYDPQLNAITINNGILGEGVYQKEWSDEQKLAGIGTVIGHEISHAFDSNGSQFDEVGAMRNWWTEEDVDYESFFEQYAKLWAMVTTKEVETYYLFKIEEHPLAYLRINCTVQQFDEFLETYDIQPGDGMYLAPEDRVLIW